MSIFVYIVVVAAAIIILEIVQIAMEIDTREKMRDQKDRTEYCMGAIWDIEEFLNEMKQSKETKEPSGPDADDEELEISFEGLEELLIKGDDQE